MAQPEKTPRSVMIVAGEASGDLHGAALVAEMKRLDPDLTFSGVGGRNLEAEGVQLIARASEMAVVGLTEVMSKLPFIVGVFFRLRSRFRELHPDVLILIDYPDFNLPLAAAAKRAGVPVFYYISPQVWAWRKGRVEKIRKVVDRMAVILPFEKAFYAEKGMDVEFVGHPLLDTVRRTASRGGFLASAGMKDAWPVIALVPGSREKEVTSLLPEMLGAAALLRQDFPDAQFALPLADTISPAIAETIVRNGPPLGVRILPGRMYDAVGSADAAMVASGTATLETALLETPMVIAYRVSPLSMAIGKRVVRVRNIGLVNIIAGKTIVPELIQEDATAPRLAAEIREMLSDRNRYEAIRRELSRVREILGEPGASRRTARLVFGLMEQGAAGSRR